MTGSWHRQGELIRLHSLIQIHTVKIMYTNTHNYAHRHTKSKNFLLICLVVAKVVMSMFERLRSGNERRSQIPCWTETSMWRHKVQQSGRKGLERVDIDAVGEHTHTHTAGAWATAAAFKERVQSGGKFPGHSHSIPKEPSYCC